MDITNNGGFDVGMYDEIIANFTAVLKADSANVYALMGRGDSYSCIGYCDKAIDDYTAVLEIEPREITALRKRGILYYELEEYDYAIADFNNALEIIPTDVELLETRAEASYLNRDTKDGDYYTAVLKVNPKYVDVLISRAKECCANQRYYDAIDCYTAILNIDPRNTVILKERAAAYWDAYELEERGTMYVEYMDKTSLDRAIDDYDTVLDIDPKDTDALKARGDIYCDTAKYWPTTYNSAMRVIDDALIRYNNAIDDYTSALNINPKDVDALKKRASAYLDVYFNVDDLYDGYYDEEIKIKERKAIENMIADYNAILNIDPNDIDIREKLAYAVEKYSV